MIASRPSPASLVHSTAKRRSDVGVSPRPASGAGSSPGGAQAPPPAAGSQTARWCAGSTTGGGVTCAGCRRRRRRPEARVDQLSCRSGHVQLGPAQLVGRLGQGGPARLVARQSRRHPTHVVRLRHEEVLVRAQGAQVVRRLGDHGAPVGDRLQDPHPLECGLGAAVQVDQHLAAREQGPLLAAREEVGTPGGHLLVRGEHQLGAQPGQVTGGAREDADPAFVGGAEVGDVDVAVPPLLTGVPGRDQPEREVDRVDPAARQLLDRVHGDLEAPGQPRGVPHGGLELLGARVLDAEPHRPGPQRLRLGWCEDVVLVRHHDRHGAGIGDLGHEPPVGDRFEARAARPR